MVELQGSFETPKSTILKINNPININDLSSHDFEFVLLKQDAIISKYTADKFTGTIATYEQDYTGYARQPLENVTRVDNIQDAYLWIADGVTFPDLAGSLQYGLIIEKDTKDIVSIMDLKDVLTFAGDITFNINVHGFMKVKV